MYQTHRGRLRALALLCAAPVAQVASAYDAPRIESVVVMHDIEAIAIVGQNLPTVRSRMAIHLGLEGEPGNITANCQPAVPLSTAITCRFAGGLPPAGDYLLRVADTRANVETGFALTLGAVGPQGPEGARGPAGPAGATGATGPAGAIGPAGTTGLPGEPGLPGETGPAGATGASGAAGPQGLAGETGPQGGVGPAGPQGTQGEPGTAGPQGPQGQTGAIGPMGPAGQAGATGAPGAIGPMGVMGPMGPAGQAGAIGATGITGAIGPVGQPGAAGAAGPAGPMGPAGATGASGPAGLPGPVGPIGATGSTGPAGPQGPWGPPGPQGMPGNSALSQHYGYNTGNAGEARGYECTIGAILLTAASYAGEGVPARGQLLPIQQYSALFALLGTAYGGDGQTTFALPDLRPVTPNNMTYSICTEGVFPSRV